MKEHYKIFFVYAKDNDSIQSYNHILATNEEAAKKEFENWAHADLSEYTIGSEVVAEFFNTIANYDKKGEE